MNIAIDGALPIFIAVMAVLSILITSRAKSEASFFHGQSNEGQSPGLLTLVLSQVTTWIFARSLMNAAILGFYYGIWGTLAYAAYYLSFVTGGLIIDSLRFQHGYSSVQAFLADRFGKPGTGCYNFVIGVRLVSEVFANLLVIGILFGDAGSGAYTLTIILFAAITLVYSAIGGFRASLKTDVLQMIVFLVVLTVLMISTATSGNFAFADLAFEPFDMSDPGPILLAVALLQVLSYPMHDPVMMDRGFLADRVTTRRSFMHAAWLSIICIMAFGSLGVLAGAHVIEGESMNDVLNRMLGDVPMLLFSAALAVSAMSTLDSSLSSSSKLVVVDMGRLQPTLLNGRLVMLGFMVLGLILVFIGNKDLFSAVAVSGTASMYLVPVILFSLWGKRTDIPQLSYLASFVIAIAGAALYFTESSGYTQWLGDAHKYTKLLWISATVMVGGCLSFWLGSKLRPRQLRAVQDHA